MGAGRPDNRAVTVRFAAMNVKRVITAQSARFSAQIFNIATVVAITLPVLLMIWIGASIFVYASVQSHPNDKVRHYHRWAGYRFYGAVGFLVPFGQPLYDIFKGWTGAAGSGLFGNFWALGLLWAVLWLAVVPWALYEIWRARRDDWQDMTVEVQS
jgi:hypothetical protein